MNKDQSTKSRGRPIDNELQNHQKQKLIFAAHQLLNSKTYKSITIREIAELAGTKSAMISYYFGNKEGLFIAVMECAVSQQEQMLQTIIETTQPIKSFIALMINMAIKNPGLLRFIHDEMLSQESPLQHAFIQGMPNKISNFVPHLIQQEIDKGNFRVDLNAKYAAFSLVCMIMTPFVIAPIREQAWKISHQDLTEPQWLEHIYTLFINGCKP